MLFTTFPFAVFLLTTLAAFYILPHSARRYLLLVASALFYMAWNAKFIILLFSLITVDYFAALWISRSRGHSRKVALLVSLGANLTMLGWFKYANFLRETWLSLFPPHRAIEPRNIVLPLGISFHTFQSISYVIDVYRGEQTVVTSYVDYALFVAFFPQLVAGPIVRAREFFRDLWHWKAPTSAEWKDGITTVVIGITKKLLFADRFAVIANAYFAQPAAFPGLLPAWTGALAYALQIYFDFSGYTDIAIGVALLFGFHFPENFRRPYLAASITEFWRRWHITLSRWLRDYVYIPLGGNRHGRLQTYRNLMLTMLIGGLWHGASWNFVVWGGYHGALLAIERWFWRKETPRGLLRLPATVFTFLLVLIGWVFFRVKTFGGATWVIGQMFSRNPGHSVLHAWDWRLAGFAAVIAIAEEWYSAVTRFMLNWRWARAAAAVVLLLAIEFFSAGDQPIPFVYFQF
jgi:D-alanyl-lipoteichoic acid acyltransferase DltB (MBOAT superfamily)